MLPSPADCGQDVPGFSGQPAGPAAIARLQAWNASPDFVVFNRPIYAGSLFNGPNSCRWSPETTAEQVNAGAAEILALIPDSTTVGLLEPAPVSGLSTWAASYAEGIQAIQNALGRRIGFFHSTGDWSRPDWAAAQATSALLAREAGATFGVVYGGASAGETPIQWLALAESRYQAFELDTLVPARAIFQPPPLEGRLLPETDRSTLTSLLHRYVRIRTALTGTANPSRFSGTLTAAGENEPLAKAAVTVSLTALEGNGQPATFRTSGTAPAGATGLLFGIRVNTECVPACRGSANISALRFRYATARQTSEHDFATGWTGWGDVSPSSGRNLARLQRGELHIEASPEQQVMINGPLVPITPGAEFEFTVLARVGPGTTNSGQFIVVFLDAGPREVARTGIRFVPPVSHSLENAITADDGRWSASLPRLWGDKIRLTAGFAGSETHWPARLSAEVKGSAGVAPGAQFYNISTLAGASPSFPAGGANTFLSRPMGVAMDRAGNLFVSGANCVFRMDPRGTVTRVAGNYRAGFSGDGGLATNATLHEPQGLALDSAGNLYIADWRNRRVRQVGLDGRIVTVAGNGDLLPVF